MGALLIPANKDTFIIYTNVSIINKYYYDLFWINKLNVAGMCLKQCL